MLQRNGGVIVRVVGPSLVPTDLGAEPPAAGVRAVAVIPEIDHHFKIVLSAGCIVEGSPVISRVEREAAAHDTADGGVRAARDLEARGGLVALWRRRRGC